jgi:hypothetical protein
MADDPFKPMLMGYLDEELAESEIVRVENHLRECRDCALELENFRKLKGATRNMRILLPDEKYWEDYWSHIYNRLERRIGWILSSLGAILLLTWGLYEFLVRFILSPNVPWILRLGVLALIAGMCTLLISVLRERIFLSKSEKYERVKR